MRTEEEAKQCWCPFARLQGANCGTYNRADSNELCIASECMAWRWKFEGLDANRTEESPGYCGLAGK